MIEWGAAALAQPGQTISGDRHLIAPFPGGALAAVVDGLGHGVNAEAAARIAVDTLQSNPAESPIALIRCCHNALMRTRGVVLTLASFDVRENCMTWLGVGNVEGVLLSATARESVLLRGGVVGYQLPPLRASVLSVARGDLLILVTDGICGGFADGINRADPPQSIADSILNRCRRGTDDALVLVVRYLGGAS